MEAPLGPASDLAIYRAILRLRGQPAGYGRKPLLELDAAQVRKLRGILAGG
jgi:4-hydroxy-tetrahydrodipicolinate synthase